MIGLFIFLPLGFYLGMAVMPRGRAVWVALALGTVLLAVGAYMVFGGDPARSADPHGGLGRAYEVLAFMMAASGFVAGVLIQLIRGATNLRSRPNGAGYWALVVAGTPSIFFPLLLDF